MQSDRLHQAGLVRVDDGLRAVAQAQLGQHTCDVRLDGGLAEYELGRCLGVGEATGEEDEDVQLTRGELRQCRGCCTRVRRAAGGQVDQAPRVRRGGGGRRL